MYRLCLTSAVLFALSAGASHAQEPPAPAAESAAPIESPLLAGVESTAQPPADSSSTTAADSSSVAVAGEETAPEGEPANVEATPAQAKTVEIKNFGEETICKDINLPGSRIVVEKRCYTRNVYDRSEAKQAELQSAATQQRIRDMRRMQDNMERMEREREMQRERAIAALMMGQR